MKLKTVIAAAAATLAIVLPAGSAVAHPTSWYWSAQKAANRVYHDNLYWTSGVDTVTYVQCSGQGQRYRGLYKHFRCYVEAIEDDPYYIKLHVISRNGFDYDFLYYA